MENKFIYLAPQIRVFRIDMQSGILDVSGGDYEDYGEGPDIGSDED